MKVMKNANGTISIHSAPIIELCEKITKAYDEVMAMEEPSEWGEEFKQMWTEAMIVNKLREM